MVFVINVPDRVIFLFIRSKEGRKGFYIAFNSLGHIATRQKPGCGKKFLSLHEKFQRGHSVAEGP